MKKTYQIPEVKEYTIKTDYQLLAGSPGYGGTTVETSGNLGREFLFDEENLEVKDFEDEYIEEDEF